MNLPGPSARSLEVFAGVTAHAVVEAAINGYGWGAMYDPGYMRDDMVVSIATLFSTVPKTMLL